MTEKKVENVCIIGLGYVGLTLAVAMANAGHKVFGVEKSKHVRDCINAGYAHFTENGLNEPLKAHVEAGTMTCSDALPAAGVASTFIVTVGTPLNKEGRVNSESIKDVIENISKIVQDGDLIVLRSTVKIGTSAGIVKPLLDKSGKKYHMAFCPERTLEGKALLELTSLPQIVGGMNPASTERATRLFNTFAAKVVQVQSLETAEMIKLVNNTQRDLMFAFSNEIAEMCDAANISATEVIHAACDDYPRSKIALPGPVGGPCLEKDPHILAEGLREHGYVPKISLAGRKLNEELPSVSVNRIARWFAENGIETLGAGKKITMLGLAFKGQPETNDLRGTMAVHILSALRAIWPDAQYCAYDPVVTPDELAQFDLSVCTTLEDAFDGASLVIIQNNHKVFSQMNINALMDLMPEPGIVYDYWNAFHSSEIKTQKHVRYAGLGNMLFSA